MWCNANTICSFPYFLNFDDCAHVAGDSGGPMLDETRTQIGVISWGEGMKFQ